MESCRPDRPEADPHARERDLCHLCHLAGFTNMRTQGRGKVPNWLPPTWPETTSARSNARSGLPGCACVEDVAGEAEDGRIRGRVIRHVEQRVVGGLVALAQLRDLLLEQIQEAL